MGQLTDSGYQIKTQGEYFDEETALYKDIDPEWNLDPSTPDGLKLAHDAEVFGALDQLIKQAYDARDPDKASGKDLDVLRKLTGSTRTQGTPTTATLKLGGVAGTFIPAGSQARTSGGVVFETDENVVLGSDGIGTVSAHCTEVGAVEVGANLITQIVTVVGGWQKVTNPAAASPGTDTDSDAVFRVKSARAVAKVGTAQRDSLYGEIYAVDGVRKVVIYENKENNREYDALHNPYSLPAHSLAIVVDGGADTAVAQAIFRKINPGCYLHAVGTKVEKVIYSEVYKSSFDIITFARPLPVDIKIEVKVKDPRGSITSIEDLQLVIRNAILDYANGELIPDGIGFVTSGFDIGEPVPYARIFTPINKVLGDYKGAYVSSMTLNEGTSTVAIAFNQKARFTAANIKVSIDGDE